MKQLAGLPGLRRKGMDEDFAGFDVQAFFIDNAKEVEKGGSTSVRHLRRHVESISRITPLSRMVGNSGRVYSGPTQVNSALKRSFAGSG